MENMRFGFFFHCIISSNLAQFYFLQWATLKHQLIQGGREHPRASAGKQLGPQSCGICGKICEAKEGCAAKDRATFWPQPPCSSWDLARKKGTKGHMVCSCIANWLSKEMAELCRRTVLSSESKKQVTDSQCELPKQGPVGGFSTWGQVLESHLGIPVGQERQLGCKLQHMASGALPKPGASPACTV